MSLIIEYSVNNCVFLRAKGVSERIISVIQKMCDTKLYKIIPEKKSTFPFNK